MLDNFVAPLSSGKNLKAFLVVTIVQKASRMWEDRNAAKHSIGPPVIWAKFKRLLSMFPYSKNGVRDLP